VRDAGETVGKSARLDEPDALQQRDAEQSGAVRKRERGGGELSASAVKKIMKEMNEHECEQ